MTLAHPTVEDLREIADQVWQSYLDPAGTSPLVPAARRPVDDLPAAVSAAVSASVSVTGAWCGHVVIAFSPAASRNAASALLGIELDDVSPVDVTDAIGELANVIGGNVKSLLPEPCVLSLPHLFQGDSGVVHWPSVVEVCQLSGEWLNELVMVSVLESSAEYMKVGQ
jgi:chemotaxis protein CheX